MCRSAVDELLVVDGDRRHDLVPPRERVHELREAVAVHLHVFDAGGTVVDLRQREVADGQTVDAAELLREDVVADRLEHVGQRHERGLGARNLLHALDPRPQRFDVFGGDPHAARRHLAGIDAQKQLRLIGMPGDDLAAGDERIVVEDEIEAALVRRRVVTPRAVLLPNALREVGRTGARIVGGRRLVGRHSRRIGCVDASERVTERARLGPAGTRGASEQHDGVRRRPTLLTSLHHC
jgi:hypothetical protein